MVVGGVTLNLAGLRFDWFGSRFEAVCRGLRRLRPDVACFQETTLRRGEGQYNQAAAIGEAVDMPYVAFAPYGNPIEATISEAGGVAVVSRWPIRSAESWRLPEGKVGGPDSRVALLVQLETPRGDVCVATTHLSWQPEAAESRKAQAAVLLDHLDGLGLLAPDAPLLLAGDFNAPEDEPAMVLIRRHLQDCFRAVHARSPGFTWSRANPYARLFGDADRRLDYAFCATKARVREARVVLDHADPVFPSDHFGLFVIVEMERRAALRTGKGK